MILFAQLLRAGGFSRAADQLGLPKSTLSRRIARLEVQIGSRLLERNTRTMRLTDVGATFLRHCNNIADEAAKALNVVEEHVVAPSGLLSINVCYSLGWQSIDSVVTEFLQRYPDVKARVVMSNRRVDLIAEGFDVAIRAGDVSEANLIAKKIGSAKASFVSSPAYLHSLSKPIKTPADLAVARLLHMTAYEVPSELSLIGPHGSQTFELSFRGVINDFQLLKHMIVNGAGVALIPSYLCHEEIKTGKLVQLLREWSLPEIRFQALYPSRQGVTPKLSAFLRMLESHLASLLA